MAPLTAGEVGKLRAKQPERDLVRAVISLINARGGFAWRNQSGRMVVESKGKRRAIHMGRRGLPDVVGVMPLDHGLALGRMVCVEAKRPGKQPTREQALMLAELRKRGALVIVAHDIADVERALT